jgi:DNA integrity scanning protein DisA with diadenylate cyclase activity
METLENKMNKEEVQATSVEVARKTTSADFSFQFSAAREHQKVEKKIFNMLCEISKENKDRQKKLGILVVFGIFDVAKDYIVSGMRQIGINPIQKYIDISSTSFKKDIQTLFREEADGAIIVNRNGQIIGSRVYLIVDNPALEVPDGCGTRHISAASFSIRDDVIAVFTLSEETSVVRTWKDSAFVDQYNPDSPEDEVA